MATDERATGGGVRRLAIAAASVLVAATVAAAPARAQYFGQNQVQYRTYDWKVLKTEHFDIYHYPEEREAVEIVARLAERWYVRLSKFFDHELTGRQPLVVYATQSQFQTTNVIPGGLGEGTGGVTEALLRRIVMPIGGPLPETDHVLGHELVHAFQYDITGRPGLSAGGVPGVARLPLWFVEGMAEYLSIGPRYAHTAMWIREASLTGLPDFGDLLDPRFFPYRFGHGLLAYVGGRWGDETIPLLLRSASRHRSVERAVQEVLRVTPKELIERWHRETHAAYDPLRETTRPIDSLAATVRAPERDEQVYNLAPAVSPDGRWMIFLSDRGLFSIDLYLADARTGEVVDQITETALDAHYQSLQFLNSSGAFDHEGRRFAFSALAGGRPVLAIYDVEQRRRTREIALPTLGDVYSPTWSPDGRYVAFSAVSGALSDLFLYDLERDTLVQLTDDAFADLQPSWSPDGRSIAFATDRFTATLEPVTLGEYQLAVLDVGTRAIRRLGREEPGKQINPQWSPDGRHVYYISDRTGIANVHRLDPASGTSEQVTNVFSGISGITDLSPAMSVALGTGEIYVSAYRDAGYGIYRLPAGGTPAGVAAARTAADELAPPAAESALAADSAAAPVPPGRTPTAVAAASPALLPPQDRVVDGIWALLQDPLTDVPADTAFAVTDYKGSLRLVYAGQPTLVAGVDRFGTFIGGGVSLYFSDLLGNHNVVTSVQSGGDLEDLGAIVAYQNLKGRWDWGAQISQIPYAIGGYSEGTSELNGVPVYVQQQYIERQTNREASFGLWYPFSRVARVEFAAGGALIDFSREIRTRAFALQTGELLVDEEEDLDAQPSIALAQASAALVFDNSIFGATSPLVGRRMRFEASPYVGDLNFVNALADVRQYFLPVRPVTVAFRLMHFGRYGSGGEDARLSPLFLGYDGIVRGYTSGSFDVGECDAPAEAPNSCPVFDQLIGSRILVGNAEVRAPLLGLLGLGSGYFGAFPIELAAFVDAGVAWDSETSPKIFGGTRDLVASAGLATRVNLFGFAILELAYVRPFDRPLKKSLWQFSFQPGF